MARLHYISTDAFVGQASHAQHYNRKKLLFLKLYYILYLFIITVLHYGKMLSLHEFLFDCECFEMQRTN